VPIVISPPSLADENKGPTTGKRAKPLLGAAEAALPRLEEAGLSSAADTCDFMLLEKT
jgi:hypothetical protein